MAIEEEEEGGRRGPPQGIPLAGGTEVVDMMALEAGLVGSKGWVVACSNPAAVEVGIVAGIGRAGASVAQAANMGVAEQAGAWVEQLAAM